MKKRLPLGITIALLLATLPAGACGDKLLGLAHGPHYMDLSHPANILLYAPAGSNAAGLTTDEQFQSAIRKGKHKLQIADTPQKFTAALDSGSFDVVLADASAAAELSHQLSAASSLATLVPIVGSQSKTEVKALQREYMVTVSSHGKSGGYLDALDEAMQLKMERNRPMTMARK
jgi:hypothetical protein